MRLVYNSPYEKERYVVELPEDRNYILGRGHRYEHLPDESEEDRLRIMNKEHMVDIRLIPGEDHPVRSEAFCILARRVSRQAAVWHGKTGEIEVYKTAKSGIKIVEDGVERNLGKGERQTLSRGMEVIFGDVLGFIVED